MEEEMDTMPPPPPIMGISGTLWIDTNFDGVWDDSEEKFQGAMVKFYNSDNGNFIGSFTTNANGKFFFNPSVVINYYLEVEMPNQGWVSTAYTNDNDLTEENGPLTCNTYSTADARVLNFGVHKGTAIGNAVWIDTGSEENVQDDNDTFYKGAIINLYAVSDNVENLIATKTSDNNGNYLFKDLRLGDYILEYVFDDADITSFVMPDQGSDEAVHDIGPFRRGRQRDAHVQSRLSGNP